jgi:hypothetical protein
MRTRIVIVPRHLIRRHWPHPELFGESVVELANGMGTDVYTDSKGRLFTQTNNERLIPYLLENKAREERVILKSGHVTLKSVSRKDADLIHAWYLFSPFRRAQSVDNELDIVHEYISHAKTINSDAFVISVRNHPVGLVRYTIIDHTGILDCAIYSLRDITHEDINDALERLKDHLTERYELETLLLHVFDYEWFMHDALKKSTFVKSEGLPLVIPTLRGFMKQIEYVYPPNKI